MSESLLKFVDIEGREKQNWKIALYHLNKTLLKKATSRFFINLKQTFGC